MKYVECDNCGRKIYMGQRIVQRKGFCGIYCSDGCYLRNDPFRAVYELTEELADDSATEIKEE